MFPSSLSRHPRLALHGLLLVLCCAQMAAAQAWTINIGAASRRVFLQVGNGTRNANNAQVNQVSVNVPANQVGTGTAQAMTSNSTQANSPLDNFRVCVPPAQVYVGGSYQRSNAANGPATARLLVTSPASLVSAAGDTIPFTEISWTIASLGADNNPNVIPAGAFTGGVQTLATFTANTYNENCHIFSYANSAPRAAGTYNGQVTYTLTVP